VCDPTSQTKLDKRILKTNQSLLGMLPSPESSSTGIRSGFLTAAFNPATRLSLKRFRPSVLSIKFPILFYLPFAVFVILSADHSGNLPLHYRNSSIFNSEKWLKLYSILSELILLSFLILYAFGNCTILSISHLINSSFHPLAISSTQCFANLLKRPSLLCLTLRVT
jgi:hypothetical protein